MNELKLLVSETEAFEDGAGPIELVNRGFKGEKGPLQRNVVKFRPIGVHLLCSSRFNHV